MNNSCNKTSDNKYFDCPARMDDGRTFTDYRPSYTVDDMIRYSNNVMGSFDYRQFLIHNGTNIMKVNNDYTKDKVGCNSCNSVKIPFNTECDVNKQFSKCHTVDNNGIGLNNVVNGFNDTYNVYEEVNDKQIKNVQGRNNNLDNSMYENFKNNNNNSKMKKKMPIARPIASNVPKGSSATKMPKGKETFSNQEENNNKIYNNIMSQPNVESFSTEEQYYPQKSVHESFNNNQMKHLKMKEKEHFMSEQEESKMMYNNNPFTQPNYESFSTREKNHPNKSVQMGNQMKYPNMNGKEHFMSEQEENNIMYNKPYTQPNYESFFLGEEQQYFNSQKMNQDNENIMFYNRP